MSNQGRSEVMENLSIKPIVPATSLRTLAYEALKSAITNMDIYGQTGDVSSAAQAWIMPTISRFVFLTTNTPRRGSLRTKPSGDEPADAGLRGAEIRDHQHGHLRPDRGCAAR
jgi:hypothetical protein